MRDAFALDGGPYHFFDRSSRSAAASNHLLGQKLLQFGVLVLELLQPFGLGDIHAAILGLPVVKRRFRDAVLARQIRGLRPGLVLLQHPNDLLFREPCSLHLSVLQRPDSKSPWRKISVAGQFATNAPQAGAAQFGEWRVSGGLSGFAGFG